MHCNTLENAVKNGFSNYTAGAPPSPTAGAHHTRHCSQPLLSAQHLVCQRYTAIAGEASPVHRQ